MNLLFAISKNYTELFLNCIRSIEKNGGAEAYDAYILHSDLGQEEQAQLQAGTGAAVRCHFVTVDPAMFDGFPETRRYPRQIYYRLAAPRLLPQQLDRVLYLDVDTVIINPLTPLYQMPFDGAYYMACSHTNHLLDKINQARLGMEEEVPYVNTGVLLMNLEALRGVLDMDRIRTYANEYKHALILPDQDILTALYGDRVKLLDSMVYNLSDRILALHNADPKTDWVDLDWVRRNSVIIHYFGKNKPWKGEYLGVLDVFYHELADA